jgi:hypothetical protein
MPLHGGSAGGNPSRRPEEEPLSLQDLATVARLAARRWPWLAPHGGPRWTVEDLDEAVCLLVQMTEAVGYRRARIAGMDRVQARSYLLAALRDRLRKDRTRNRRLVLIGQEELDALAYRPRSGDGIGKGDAALLAADLARGLSPPEVAEVARRWRGCGPGAALARSAPGLPSRATRVRLWARARRKIRSWTVRRGVARDDLGGVLEAMVPDRGGALALGESRDS